MNSWATKITVIILLLTSVGVIVFEILSPQNLQTTEATRSQKEKQSEVVPQPESELNKPIFCPSTFEPVCGYLEGKEKSFINRCEAEKTQAFNITDGLCSPEEDCPKTYDPVCGMIEDNPTDFNNLCLAETAGATNIEPHRCPANPKGTALCPDMPGPVCATLDGKRQDFDNACAAQQAGAMEIQPNKCPLSSDLGLNNTPE